MCAILNMIMGQTHSKSAVLPGYDAALTEAENMFHSGYRRVWDAGQSVWVYQHT